MSAAFDAKRPGQCARCTERIARGDRVQYDHGRLIHAGCAP